MADTRRIKRENSKRMTYEVGNTVRVTQANPVRKSLPDGQRTRPYVSKNINKNREKALHMNLGYVIFLSIAASVFLLVCTNYIQTRTESTNITKQIASLESEVNELKTQNDARYNSLMASVDLEYIKDVAINELGMVYASEDQVILYSSNSNDYVSQYESIPDETK